MKTPVRRKSVKWPLSLIFAVFLVYSFGERVHSGQSGLPAGESYVHCQPGELHLGEFTIIGMLKDSHATPYLAAQKVIVLFTMGMFDESGSVTEKIYTERAIVSKFVKIPGPAQINMGNAQQGNLKAAVAFKYGDSATSEQTTFKTLVI